MPHSTPSQAYRTLPYPTTHQRRCRSFGAWFSPVTSSAQADSTSELLPQENPADPAACLPLFRVSGGAL
ncbi:hypothetical protein [Escherichia coli]|uniref:hypothetical protein n=1 Tax=Escherichia coli TaxID=562 RepID=UPI003987A083